MALREKIILIYPQLTNADFDPWQGTIMLQNDSDGKGEYIKEWNYPTLPKPTDEQLGAA
jgi:hypothetical protein